MRKIALLLPILLFYNSCISDEQVTHIDYDTAFREFEIATAHEDSSDYLEAAIHFQKAAEAGFEPNTAYYYAAANYVKASEMDSALDCLKKMVDLGVSDYRYFEYSDDFSDLIKHPKYAELKNEFIENERLQKIYRSNPENIIIETSDIGRFWSAFEQAKDVDSKKEKISIYRQEYFEKGSIGLRDFTFLKMRDGGIEGFVDFVENHRPYYTAIKEPVNDAVKKVDSLDYFFTKVRQYIPEATLSNYYFVIGRHTSFGTVSMNGSLIGLENVINEHTPVHLIPEQRQAVVAPASFLPWVLIHELIHTYQNISNPSLLGATITEGTADFITELVLGPPKPEPEYRVFGKMNEKMVWQEFRKNLESHDLENWIASLSEEKKAEGWPSDMGYFVGYQIAKNYYAKADDKDQAIIDLLENKDPFKILNVSGYMRDN